MQTVLAAALLVVCVGQGSAHLWNRWGSSSYRYPSNSYSSWWSSNTQSQTDCTQQLRDAEAQRCANLQNAMLLLGAGPYTRCRFASALQGQMSPFEAGLLFNGLDTNNDNSLTLPEVNAAINNVQVCQAYYDALAQQNLINGVSLGIVSN